MSSYNDVLEFFAEILTTQQTLCECGGELTILDGYSICKDCGKKTMILKPTSRVDPMETMTFFEQAGF